jgi:hypothetical protein
MLAGVKNLDGYSMINWGKAESADFLPILSILFLEIARWKIKNRLIIFSAEARRRVGLNKSLVFVAAKTVIE